MTNRVCNHLGQNVTSFSAKVTPEVTPEILCSVYTISTFFMDCYLVTSIIRSIHGKIFSLFVQAHVYVHAYSRTSIF